MAERENDNWTSSTDFVLLGIRDVPILQNLLFLLLLMIYSVTMVGNILIVVLVVADRHLHTPMYFFLGNLSSLETCYSSTILPRLLASFLTGDNSISAHGCMAQFYFFASFATTECYLLAAMSYDRYLAICQPLLYASLMTWKVSFHLAAASWLGSSLLLLVVTVVFSQLQFCGPKSINHFFCEFSPVLELAHLHLLLWCGRYFFPCLHYLEYLWATKYSYWHFSRIFFQPSLNLTNYLALPRTDTP